MVKIWENNREIKIFQEYLKIPSVHPNIDYSPCVDFLKHQADDLGLDFKVVYSSHPAKPLCVISYYGTNPSLKSIMMSSHMDVVPVEREKWSRDPFGAEIDENGNIYARGSQDTKGIGTQYLGALRYFIKNKIQFKRTIHVTFTPEEEIGSMHGMEDFIKTDEFKSLNVGFAFDEGAPNPTDEFILFYGERSIWHTEFTITGDPGHGSIMLDNTAAVKLQKLITKFTEYRESEVSRLPHPSDIQTMGKVTSTNVTMIKGGTQSNVIPSEYKMTVDCRISLDVDHDEFVKMIDSWCNEAGKGITYKFQLRGEKVPALAIDDDSNIYWAAVKKSFHELNLNLISTISPGATDIRFVRKLGIPAVNFSPMNNTPVLCHAHDEFLNAEVYLKGIEIYKKIIENLGNLD